MFKDSFCKACKVDKKILWISGVQSQRVNIPKEKVNNTLSCPNSITRLLSMTLITKFQRPRTMYTVLHERKEVKQMGPILIIIFTMGIHAHFLQFTCPAILHKKNRTGSHHYLHKTILDPARKPKQLHKH